MYKYILAALFSLNSILKINVKDVIVSHKPKVLVIVHSFIRRLESWMERTKSDLSSTIDTKLYGIGGRQVHSLKHFDLHVVKKFEPE